MGVATNTKRWTLEELDTLPDDDGNVYELIHGELFVTPAPTPGHETVAARLRRGLDPYVEEQGLGLVYAPRSVVQLDDSQVEPDLAVRQPPSEEDWRAAPPPILVVEILSASTRRMDRIRKRAFYLELGVPEYWMVDPEQRSVTVIGPGALDVTVRDRLTWNPVGAMEPLVIELASVFAAG